ncbi:hypothetical protein HWV62_11638 [Athelia sp. TMB]|nr:hypothetical protein HWV62_11638 [Athelia sp. TMB]
MSPRPAPLPLPPPLPDYTRWPDTPLPPAGPPAPPPARAVRWTRPIAALAPELLCLVFHAGAALPPAPGLPFAVLVAHVSARWRRTAHADPFLWTRLAVAPGTPPARVAAYLARARAFPLDIVLHSPAPPAALAALIAHAHRWRTLDVSARTRADLAPLRPLTAPLLASLSIRCPPDPAPDPRNDDRTLLFAGGAPQLAHVHLDGLGLNALSVPLRAATRVSLLADPPPDDRRDAMSWEAFHASLSGGAVRTLRLQGALFAPGAAEDGDTTLALPALTHLELPLCASGATARLLSRLSAPSLESLHFRTSADPQAGADADAELHLLCPRSFPALTRLTLDCADIREPGTFTTLARAFPSLAYIELAGTRAHTAALLCAALGGGAWPRLKEVALREWEALDEPPLRAMLAARSAADRPLDRVLLSGPAHARLGPALGALVRVEELV